MIHANAHILAAATETAGPARNTTAKTDQEPTAGKPAQNPSPLQNKILSILRASAPP